MIQIRDSYQLPGKSPVVIWLVIINILSYVAQGSAVYAGFHPFDLGGMIPAHFTNPEALNPDLLALKPPALVTVILYTFFHVDFWHLFWNMFYLWIFGRNVERHMGSGRFLFYYFSCTSVGALFHVWLNSSAIIPVIGASGGVVAMYGAYFALFPRHDIRITLGSPRTAYYRDILIPFKVLLVIYLVGELMGMLLPHPGGVDRTAYFVHLGGLITGYLLAGGNFKGLPKTGKRNFKVFRGGMSA
ncbi:MAG: rhomboid family intramembrane serine protease [Acidobacteriota bacterium]|nr:rhomboid family intramembrane serine protease [Acidobacteriota bacterium]